MGIVDDPRTVIMTLDAQFSDQATEVDSALSGDQQSNVQPRTRTLNASFDEDGKKHLRVSSFRSTKSDEGTDTDEFEHLNVSNGDHSSTGSLHEELQRAKHEVLIREEELNTLRSIRNKMEDEVRDLTASLFEVSAIIYYLYDLDRQAPNRLDCIMLFICCKINHFLSLIQGSQ